METSAENAGAIGQAPGQMFKVSQTRLSCCHDNSLPRESERVRWRQRIGWGLKNIFCCVVDHSWNITLNKKYHVFGYVWYRVPMVMGNLKIMGNFKTFLSFLWKNEWTNVYNKGTHLLPGKWPEKLIKTLWSKSVGNCGSSLRVVAWGFDSGLTTRAVNFLEIATHRVLQVWFSLTTARNEPLNETNSHGTYNGFYSSHLLSGSSLIFLFSSQRLQSLYPHMLRHTVFLWSSKRD